MFCIADILYAHHQVCETYFTVNQNGANVLTYRRYSTFQHGTEDPAWEVFIESMQALGYTAGRIISDNTTGEIVVTEIVGQKRYKRYRAEGGLISASNAIERNVRCLEAGIKEAARRAQGVHA